MSIWCSNETIGFDDDAPDEPNVGQVRSYIDGWSNHYPTIDGAAEQEAWIDTAYIAPWCVPGQRDTDRWDAVGPWLRLSVDAPYTRIGASREVEVGERRHVSVVLDEEAVAALQEALSRWQAAPKVHPAPDAEETR